MNIDLSFINIHKCTYIQILENDVLVIKIPSRFLVSVNHFLISINHFLVLIIDFSIFKTEL